MENIYEIPIWKKYTLSVEEAAVYFLSLIHIYINITFTILSFLTI